MPPAVILPPTLRRGGAITVHCVGANGVHFGNLELVTSIGIVLKKKNGMSFFPFSNIVEMEF
jgi:hypothetical protein